MGRSRMIKPEFWTDAKLTECSLSARLLFIGLWNFSDDQGNIELIPKQIKMLVFPGDVVNTEKLLDELLGVGVLTAYSVNGAIYGNIKNFLKHQKINRPSAPRCPPFSEDTILTEYSLSTHAEVKGSEVKRSKSISCEKNKHQRNTYPDEFKSFWSVYPKRMAKAPAFKAWVKKVRTYQPDDIISAAKEYAEQCAKERKEEQFILHPATFLNQDRWKDYCYEETGTPS